MTRLLEELISELDDFIIIIIRFKELSVRTEYTSIRVGSGMR